MLMKYLRGTAAVLLATASLALAGCPGVMAKPPNPVASADRPEVVGLALYGSFVIAEEALADIADDPNTPKEVVQGIVTLDAAASPVFEQLRPVAEETGRIRLELDAAMASPECQPEVAEQPPKCTELQAKLLVVSKSLNDWITRAAPLLRDLVAAINGVRKPQP